MAAEGNPPSNQCAEQVEQVIEAKIDESSYNKCLTERTGVASSGGCVRINRRYSKKTTVAEVHGGQAAPVLENRSPISEIELGKLAEELQAKCASALKAGLGNRGSRAALPLPQALHLADLARDILLSSWEAAAKATQYAWSEQGVQTMAGERASVFGNPKPGDTLSPEDVSYIKSNGAWDFAVTNGVVEKVKNDTVHPVVPSTVSTTLANLCVGLTDTFNTMSKSEVPRSIDDVVTHDLENLECALCLAALYLNVSAMSSGALPQYASDSGESLEDAVLCFVSHVVRALFGSKGAGGSTLGSSAAHLANAIAGVWRATHRAIASVDYALTPLSRRVLPLVARCLLNLPFAELSQDASSSPLSIVGAAASDLMVACVGQGEANLQELAEEELTGGSAPLTSCRSSTSAKGKGAPEAIPNNGAPVPTKSRGRRRRLQSGPNPYTAALLRAVSSAGFPGRPTQSIMSQEVATTAATICLQQAEARASKMVAGILKRSVLAVVDRESEGWMRLEALLREVLANCGNPLFPAAPILVLCFARGLSKIVGASRSVDMSWIQREFAARLLGMIGTYLCREAASVAKCETSDADIRELKNWASAVARKVGKQKKTRVEEGAEDDFPRLFIDFLQGSCIAPVVMPPICDTTLSNNSARETLLDSAILPSDHPIYSTALILCSWAVPETAGFSEINASQKKRKQAIPQCQRIAHAVTLEALPDHANAELTARRDWAQSVWSSCMRIETVPSARIAHVAGKAHDVAKASLLRLYNKSVHADLGALSRARVLCLEVLLTQLQSSPLVFVRRQAMCGLAEACYADVRLANSRCAGEALSRGLQDDSALVRAASIDFVGRLTRGKAEGIEARYACELRAAARARLSDAASGVRRAAFRVVCDALCREDPALMTSVCELFPRIRHETPQIRAPVLSALERVLLSPPLPEVVLGQLRTLVAHEDIGGAGVQDLLKSHRGAHDYSTFASSLLKIAADATQEISTHSSPEDGIPAASILEQVALQHPESIFHHMKPLQDLLSNATDASPGTLALAEKACRILSDILPHWATQSKSAQRKQLGAALQRLLTPLLEAPRNSVTRSAMECLCQIALHVTADHKDVLTLVCNSLQYIRQTVERGSTLHGDAQQILCRHAWIISTAHEFLDLDCLSKGIEEAEPDLAAVQNTVGLLCRLLSALCLKGPIALRPLLVPCVGFLARRHTFLMQTKLGPAEVFQSGLKCEGSCTWIQANTMETVADLLAVYLKAAENGTPPGGVKDEAVTRSLLAPKVSEAVQRVAELQPIILRILCSAIEPNIALHALAAVRSLSHLGVLHPAPALVSLVAASLSSSPSLVAEASRFMVKLVEAGPQQLLSRLGMGIRQAASILKQSREEPGNLLNQSWRFSTLAELCSEHFEAKRLRENFIDALLTEVNVLSSTPPSHSEAGSSLRDVELLLGIFLHFPYRNELELARILRFASQFMTLHTIPLLPETAVTVMPSKCLIPGICRASLLLYSLCERLCSPADMQRLLTEEDNGEADRPLPQGFSRRVGTRENCINLLKELSAVETEDNAAALTEILARHVPADSLLLKGRRGEERNANREGKGRGRKRLADPCIPPTLEKKRRASATEASLEDALAAAGA